MRMKSLKKILTLVSFVCPIVASAQLSWDDDEWGRSERPIHMVEESITSDGLHRAPHRIGSHENAALKSEGERKVPVILVNFADRKFTLGTMDNLPDSLVTDSVVRDYYDKYCNGTMDGSYYSGHGSYGSIRDYFVTMSDSTFLPKFEVLGPVTLDYGYATYGKNSGSTKDTGYSKFRTEAMAKAVQMGADWTQFDNDGNGTVDMVFFLFAGWGESNTGTLDPDAIWPKESASMVDIGGVKVATTAACHELRVNVSSAYYDEKDPSRLIGFKQTKPDGIGVFIHELSHALGLPDFYDTRGVAFGMDLWSVMDYGEYGDNGFCPGGYTAYERDFMGWQKLVEIDTPQVITLKCFADGGCGYKIVNDQNMNEYYVLENRQAKGWDEKVCGKGHGLQVTHVDYYINAWQNNSVNTDPKHQRMTIIAANNNYNGSNAAKTSSEWNECLAGNLYPGQSYNFNLTDESTPASVCYTGDYMHKPIRNITENEDGTITLCFKTNGKLETPEVEEADAIEMDRFDIRWSSVENATKYIAELYREDNDIEDVPYLVAVDTLSETSISYTGLLANRGYKYRVKAMADSPEDYVDSEWSEYVYTKTLIDAIENVPSGSKTIDVYLLNGQCIGRYRADDLSRLSLHEGIYVVRYMNGSCKKIYIK